MVFKNYRTSCTPSLYKVLSANSFHGSIHFYSKLNTTLTLALCG